MRLVYEELRALILNCTLQPGEITSQVALSQLVPTSRTPLREALRLLQREGLVILEPNRRVRIADVSMEEFEGLQVMRIALEAVALRYTIPRLVSEDFAELEGLMAQMDMYMEVGDSDRFQIPHRAFHLRLTRAVTDVQQTYLRELYDHTTRYRRFNYAILGPADYEIRRAEHRAIVAAARDGDADAAIAALANHYQRTVSNLSARLNGMPEQVLLAVRVVTSVAR